MTGLLYKAIETIYDDTKCYNVRINDLITDEFYAEAGVRQGDPLSATLFGVYINDFPSFINSLRSSDAIYIW